MNLPNELIDIIKEYINYNFIYLIHTIRKEAEYHGIDYMYILKLNISKLIILEKSVYFDMYTSKCTIYDENKQNYIYIKQNNFIDIWQNIVYRI